MRAFVALRRALAGHEELARKLDEPEARYDRQFRVRCHPAAHDTPRCRSTSHRLHNARELDGHFLTAGQRVRFRSQACLPDS